MGKFNSFFCILLLIQISAFAQKSTKADFSKAIEDNSFLIEEAYNQEDRVVQHINNGQYSLVSGHDFSYSFTQEWPFGSENHQFSYTLGFSSLNNGDVTGLNDFMLNYRYQLTGHDDLVTIAPRFTIIIPTGNNKKGLGSGTVGYQFNLPASKRIANNLAAHLNIGYTILPNAGTTDNLGVVHKNTISVFNTGASAIWLVTKNTNIMLEALYIVSHKPGEANLMVNTGQMIVSPGIRHAIEIKNLEIVPGIALPVTIQNDDTTSGIFFYLSFEHPF